MSAQEMDVGDFVWLLMLDRRNQPKEYVRVQITKRDGWHFTVQHANGHSETCLGGALSWQPNRRLTVGVRS